MNIYNLNQFKCSKCQQWFHPKYAQPYTLPCSHSLCKRCLSSFSGNKPSRSICCPYHKTQQSLDKVQLNEHIQEALERLIKNSLELSHSRPISDSRQLQKELESLISGKFQDMYSFKELMERIYSNQINRILHLRNRVRQEIFGHYQAFEQWKLARSSGQNQIQILNQGKDLLKKIRQFNQLDLEQMAERVIEEPSFALQRNFSIYDLLKRQRKTLKSSIRQNHSKLQSSESMPSFKKADKQNDKFLNFMVKTVQSPQKQGLNQLSNILCKELSSFKLNSSMDRNIPERALNESKMVQQFKLSTSIMEEHSGNDQIALKEGQFSKNSLKTRANEKRQKKLSHFAELINSLKSEEELAYSPQISQQLLLSQKKQEINFLQECPVEKKDNRNEVEVRKRKIIDCELENNKYIRKMEEVRTEQAFLSTTTLGNTLQLFNFDLKEVDIRSYLQRFDWSVIEAVKLVGTGLQDAQFNQLLNCLIKTKIYSLTLPSNELQQISLDALLNFTNINKHLKSVSLQKNNISALHGNARSKIAMLRRRGITLYI